MTCLRDTEPSGEICDDLDNNCNGETDEGFDPDADGIADCFDNCPKQYHFRYVEKLPVETEGVEAKSTKAGHSLTGLGSRQAKPQRTACARSSSTRTGSKPLQVLR